MSQSRVTLVVPVYCEEEIIEEFHRRAAAAMRAIQPAVSFDILFVNDGSTDGTLEKLFGLAQRFPNEVKVINLSRNFGHQLAITAGIDHAEGDAVVLIDGDLQDPPEVISKMVAQWRSGYQVVYGQRAKRKGETWFKLITAKVFYRLMERLSTIKIPLDTGDFRLIDRKVVDSLRAIREDNRYIRGLVSWVGFRQIGVEYERDERYAGVTKFNFVKMMRFAFDGLTSFSEKPLRLSSQLGFFTTIAALGVMAWVILGRMLHPEHTIQGWASVMAVVLFIGGVQLVCIGILGEYIGRIYRESKGRPLYFVADKIGFK